MAERERLHPVFNTHPCGCGCGIGVESDVRFVRGHHCRMGINRLKKLHPIFKCSCGCGKVLSEGAKYSAGEHFNDPNVRERHLRSVNTPRYVEGQRCSVKGWYERHPEERKVRGREGSDRWKSHPEWSEKYRQLMLKIWEDPEYRRLQASSRSVSLRSRQPTVPELLSVPLLEPLGFLSQQPFVFWTCDWVHPDFLVVVEINGCRWHVHTNPSCTTVWKDRLKLYDNQRANVVRDQSKRTYCRNRNIPFFEIWECELKDPFKREILDAKLEQIRELLRKAA